MNLTNMFRIRECLAKYSRIRNILLLGLTLGLFVATADIANAADDLPEVNVVLDGVCDEYPDELSLESFVGDVPDMYAFYDIENNSVILCTPEEIEGTITVDLFFTYDDIVGPRYFVIRPGEFKRTYPHLIKDTEIEIAPHHDVFDSQAIFGENSIEIRISALDFELGEREIPRISHVILRDHNNVGIYTNKPSMKPLPVGINNSQTSSGSQQIDLSKYHRLPEGWRVEIMGNPLYPQPIDIVSGLGSDTPGLFVFLKDYLSESGVVQRISYISPDAKEEYCHIDFNNTSWFLSPGPNHSALVTIGKEIKQIKPDCTTEVFANAFAEHDGRNTVFHPFDYHPEFGVLVAPQNNEALYSLRKGEYERISEAFTYMYSAIWGPDGRPIVWDGALGKIFHGDDLIYSHPTYRGSLDIFLNPADNTKLLLIQARTGQEIDLDTRIQRDLGDALDYCTWNPDAFIISPDGNTLIFVDPAKGEIGKYDLNEDVVTILSEGSLSPALSVSPDGTINTIVSSCDSGFIQRYHPDGTTSKITGLPIHMLDMRIDNQGDYYVLATDNQYEGGDIGIFILNPDGSEKQTILLPPGFRPGDIALRQDGNVFLCDHFSGSCRPMNLDGSYDATINLGDTTMLSLTNEIEPGVIYGAQIVDTLDSTGILTSNRYLIQIDLESRKVRKILNFTYVGEESFISPSVYIDEAGRVGVNFTSAPIPTDLWNVSPDGLQYLLDNYSDSNPMSFSEFRDMTSHEGIPFVQQIAAQIGVDSWGNESIYKDGGMHVYVASPVGLYVFSNSTP